MNAPSTRRLPRTVGAWLPASTLWGAGGVTVTLATVTTLPTRAVWMWMSALTGTFPTTAVATPSVPTPWAASPAPARRATPPGLPTPGAGTGTSVVWDNMLSVLIPVPGHQIQVTPDLYIIR